MKKQKMFVNLHLGIEATLPCNKKTLSTLLNKSHKIKASSLLKILGEDFVLHIETITQDTITQEIYDYNKRILVPIGFDLYIKTSTIKNQKRK